jgi:surfactin synthase thioesterase subunit
VRLFCFPYAGGGAAVFRDWPAALPADIEVAAVQLPGREWRIKEAPLASLTALAQDALAAIQPYLDKPFALLGASMGGTLIFELARRLRQAQLPAPCCLLPLAVGGPQTPETELLHNLPDSEFIAELRAFGVMSEEFLQHAELVELALPVLRADCVAQETYVYQPEAPFEFPIWAYGGRSDATVPEERLAEWAELTTGVSQVQMIDGGHLFMDGQPELLMQSLARRIYQSLP